MFALFICFMDINHFRSGILNTGRVLKNVNKHFSDYEFVTHLSKLKDQAIINEI